MAEFHFNNDHNKFAYLLKPTESQGFHQIIDFMNDGVKGLMATIDGTVYTITKASIRSALQLDDHNAIDTMTNEEIFVGLRDIRQSSPPLLPFGPAPSSRVVSTKPMPNIPSLSEPSEPVLEIITSPIRDDDTGGGSFYESPPPTLEAELKATKILHRDTMVLFAKRIKKLESKLKTKKRKLVLSDSENEEEARQSKELDALLDLANAALPEPSPSTTPSKPANPEQARVATIIYKRLKKQQSSSGLDFTNAAIPAVGLDSAGGLVSAGGVDSAGGLTSVGISVATGPTVLTEPSSPIRDPSKGKVIATPSSPVTAPTATKLADKQTAILEAERQELIEQELKQSIDAEQVYLDSLLAQRVAEEQARESMSSEAHLVDKFQANPTLSVELLGADVSEDTFSVKMVDLMNRRRKAIAEMKAKAKREKPMTPAQQKEFMRTFIVYDKIRRVVDLVTAKDHHQNLKRSGGTLESLESKKLKSSHSTTQPTELQETTSVSAGAIIAAGDPIPAVTSVSAASFIPAATLIAAGVSATAGASGSASEASVLIIELLDSPPKDTSLPLDPETEEHDAHLRKSSRKKSIARKRTLPSPFKPKSDALPFDEDDPEAKFKRYLRQASDYDEPVKSVSLALKYPLTPETIQRMLHHGLEIDRDPSGNDLTTAIQLIQSLLNQLNPAP
nr:hypothetical protein [Tanacetum cinerariifolium]